MNINKHSAIELTLQIVTVAWVASHFTLYNFFLLYATMVVFHTHMTVFMHRAWCHRGWIPTYWLNVYGLTFTSLILVGASPGWCAIHRQHHRFSDTEQDPHHRTKSVWRLMFYQDLKPDFTYAKDLLQDPLHRWFFNHTQTIQLCWVILLAVLSPEFLFFWVAAAGLNRFVMNLINVVLHSRDAGPVNSPFWAVIFLQGEPWHANHHNQQKDWRLGREWWQLDIGKNLIQVFVALGWAKAR